MDEELELTTDGSDIFVSRKAEPFVICAISVTSAAVKTDGDYCARHLLVFAVVEIEPTLNLLNPLTGNRG